MQHVCEFMSSKVARLIICADDDEGGGGLLGVPRGEHEIKELQTTLIVLRKIPSGYDVQITELITRAQVDPASWDGKKMRTRILGQKQIRRNAYHRTTPRDHRPEGR